MPWKLFGKTRDERNSPQETPACSHLVLLPRWDRLEDMGHEEKIVGYTCDACGEKLPLAAKEQQRRY
jgi:hypothetical protein